MSEPLQHLATWAANLNPEDVPHDVLVRAQLQHLSAAGNLRAVGEWSFASQHASAAARSAAKCALIDFSDHLFWGKTTLGGVFAALESPAGRTALQSLTATVVANEVAARYGAASSLSAEAGQHAARVHCLSAAAATAKILGLSAAQTRSAYSRALTTTPIATVALSQANADARAQFVGDCIDAGVESATWASNHSGGAPLSGELLSQAFTGLGECWLGRTTSFSLYPGHLFTQVPVQAVQEILKRHVKAADKRLRIDQIDRIEIRSHALTLGLTKGQGRDRPLDPASVCADLRRQIGALFVTHELDASSIRPEELKRHAESIEWVADRVELVHDWSATLALVKAMRDSMSPLYGAIPLRDLWKTSRSPEHGFGWSGLLPPADQWSDLIKARPDRLLRSVNNAVDLSGVDERSFRYCLPTEVKLFTTRGGWWPERRDTPEGAPGWNWQATVNGVAKKFGCGDARDTSHAAELMATLPQKSTTTWKRALKLPKL